MTKIVLLLGIFLVGAMLFACAPKVVPVGKPTLPKAQVIEKEGWEPEWKKALNAGKYEGKVLLYTTAGADIRALFTKAMKEKYGLEMEFVTARGVEMIQKILRERHAGIYMADAYMAGVTSAMTMLVPVGAVDSLAPELVLPEVVDTKYWYGNKLPFIDKEQRFLGFRGNVFWPFTINTNFIKPEEVTSFKDLLNPKFKGKIAMNDPTIEGGSNSFTTLVAEYVLDRNFLRELVKQELFFSRDERLITEWVARGKYWILIGTKPDPITEFRKVGAPLLPIIPKEGSMMEPGAGTIGVINKRPHYNATRIFVNWLLSKEGQTFYAEAAGIESAREDVSKAHLDPGQAREPGKKYIFGDDEFRQIASNNLQFSKEIFGPLLK